ncbi:MAG: carboxymuconolactone decarboxylase family protein [Methanoculleus sp.]|jgi:AhpD family alkylhydroperoxidase|nr:carboxymuconolactone decarboxylase family protein [Methanoculleus sp.]
MKPESEKLVDEFLIHADDLGDEIVEDIEEILGIVPFIFTILRDRPDIFVLSTIADYKTSRPKSLDPKTAELVTIAAAAASEADSCLKVHIGAALKEGVSRDQILDTLLIAAMIGKTRILASSLRQFRDACGVE